MSSGSAHVKGTAARPGSTAGTAGQPQRAAGEASELRFPAGFLWGAATSAHQVEGDNRNSDWWAFEEQPGRIARGERSGWACDHYRRFREDFDLAAQLGHNAHRFSVEWSRIEPESGRFEQREIDHYSQVVDALLERGLEPMVTLHHFSSPAWFSRAGGWERGEAPGLFERFVRRVAEALGDRVRLWITINEPTVYVFFGHVFGDHAPGRRDPIAAMRVMRNLLEAHARAYRVLHEAKVDVQVGIAHHYTLIEPGRPWHPMDRWMSRLADRWFNRLALQALSTGRVPFPAGHGQRLPELVGTQDFLGLNYYGRVFGRFDPRFGAGLFFRQGPRAGSDRGDMDWEIYPEGLYRLLRSPWFGGTGLPIYVTENGIATADHRLRTRYLLDHLRAVGRAIAEGIDVRGYFHWSLLDNFEWHHGYAMRFGLVEVDYATQRRVVRPTALVMAEIARRGRVPGDRLQAQAKPQ